MSLFGKLALALWYKPSGRLIASYKSGGPIEQWKTEAGSKEMAAAAPTLPPLSGLPQETPVALSFLTGGRFWFQTVFCLHSLSQVTRLPKEIHFFDDGSLAEPHKAALRRFAPGAVIHEYAELMDTLEKSLPLERYPFLRDRWLKYPNIRKLTDPHLARHGWNLVLDSDLLFFREPTFLVDWWSEPKTPLHAVDCEQSYGYSTALMSQLCGARIPSLVNVGISGLHSSLLDWDRMEFWCKELISKEGTNYYLEQALFAMLVANSSCAVAPAHDYVTFPKKEEADKCRAVMHHYVAESKRWYFQNNWKLFTSAPSQPEFSRS